MPVPSEQFSPFGSLDLNSTVTYNQSNADNDDEKGSRPQKSKTWRWSLEKGILLFFHHMRKHVGVGLICSVAYFDPGNWGVDLEAGSGHGYRLLFVILLAGLFAIFLQVLASRLGCVTGLDLASHTRLLLHDHPTHPYLIRWAVLYPLYVLAEIAIIATDLAELLGSAIALCLLFPSLELWHGVLITTGDVIFLLCLGDPLRGKPLRWFELLIGGLVFAVMICMCIIISRIDVNWGDTFLGYLPSKYVFPNGAGYVSVGIIGATVMPHSLFLGSALATQDRISASSPESDTVNIDSTPRRPKLERVISVASSVLETKQHIKNFFTTAFNNAFHAPKKGTTPKEILKDTAKSHSQWVNNSQEFVKKHIYHGTVDIVFSLLGFAVVINSLILILASAVFFYGGTTAASAGLFDAYDLIKNLVGTGAATIFALALLFAGQSSSLIATVAGQAVAEGFLRWRVSPIVRRLLTRLIAVIPSMAVAIAMGRPGIDALLIASQVVLSIVLPFISFPLVYLTSRRSVMSVRIAGAVVGPSVVGDNSQVESTFSKDNCQEHELESQPNSPSAEKIVDYSNSWFTTIIAFSIWLVIVIANVYVLVTLHK